MPAARLASDQRGVTIVEFGIVAPVLCLFLMGAMDVAHTLYMEAALEGSVQKAARDSALETGIQRNIDGAIDNKIKDEVHALNNAANINITRRYYRTFADAAAATHEPFTDVDGDKKCNHNEPYQDINGNNVWDADGADDGQGGAKDRVLYTVKIKYDRLFPLAGWIGLSRQVEMQASTILANQPYGDQGTYATPQWKNCP